ncbi:MAG: F0F1 ATP synthase subunit A [Metamycoplasmataceae bacterium]
MGQLGSNLFEWIQPQLITLIYVVLVVSVLSIVVYFKVRKVKPEESPRGIALIAEQYVGVFQSEFSSTTEGKIDRVTPYIFTLITFMIIGNTSGFLALEPISTSYSIPLILAIISWLGIYVFGIMHQRLLFFKKFLNPIELIGQFSPLISLSFRIYGNILGGAIMMFLVYYVCSVLWGLIPIVGEINLLGMVVAPWFHMYFDLFGSLIQSYIFALLTCIYWSTEVEHGEEIQEAKKILREEKKQKKEKKKTSNIVLN